MSDELAEMDVPVSPGLVLALEPHGTHAPKKHPPSVISNHLREELIRILRMGDAKNDGAFTVVVATQVEKFVAAAREILMTESMAQNDLASLMMSRRQLGGPYGYLTSGYNSLGTDGMLLPSVNNENFGVQAIRQIVEASRSMSETPEKLVAALVVARENNLPDVVAALEKKLGVSKEEPSPDRPIYQNPQVIDPQGPLQ
jgi:hypothetical protein